jgi:hypothetical protein
MRPDFLDLLPGIFLGVLIGEESHWSRRRITGRSAQLRVHFVIRIANAWLIVNVGGGPTPDKPTVTLSVSADPDKISSFMNIRVADIQACYELWKSRGTEFLTEPIAKYGEIRCYIRDPDGYIIEVGQSTDLTYG